MVEARVVPKRYIYTPRNPGLEASCRIQLANEECVGLLAVCGLKTLTLVALKVVPALHPRVTSINIV